MVFAVDKWDGELFWLMQQPGSWFGNALRFKLLHKRMCGVLLDQQFPGHAGG